MDPAAGLRWETVDCPLCGKNQWAVLVEAGDPLIHTPASRITVVQCRDCGLSFTNPRPAPESIAQFYPADYAPHQSVSQARPSRTAGKHRPLLRLRFLGRPSPGRDRLLDFGCGSGAFLQWMHHLGWKVTGLDASPAAVGRIQQELGLCALIGTLPDPRLPNHSFDCITMWQSLEHVPRPLPVLRDAHRLLAPGGVLVVAAPNIESLAFRLFGADWFGLDLPRHLVHFSPRTLRRIVEMAGFQVYTIHGQRHASWLQSSARLARRRGRRRLHWLAWRPLASLVARYGLLVGRADSILLVAGKLRLPALHADSRKPVDSATQLTPNPPQGLAAQIEARIDSVRHVG
jgi:SAM-dependent methyltransferase